MDAKNAIRSAANFSSMVLKSYVSDLDDADLIRRPTEGCNHLAWQLGHLIASEVHLLEMAAPGNGVALPEGFVEAHAKEQAGNDDPAAFLGKDAYIELYDKVREASDAALTALPDDALDNASPEQFSQLCPTIGDLFVLIATHPMMHAGQFVIVRRQLGKPVLI